MREIVKMVSTANTGFYYTATRNKKVKQEKMEMKKFDPVVRKHVVFKEKPISK